MKAVFVILGLLLLSGASYAALDDWKIDISLNEDNTADWIVTLQYDSFQSRNEYFVFSRVSNVRVSGDSKPLECKLQYTVGTTITCSNFSAVKIEYRFTTIGNIEIIEANESKTLNRFRYRFSVTNPTDRFSFIVRLPLGGAVVEEEIIKNTGYERFEPEWGREGSDGRRIFVEWISENPKLGNTYESYVIFEDVSSGIINQINPDYVIITAVAVAIIAAGFFIFSRRRKIEEILPVMNNGERAVMEILIREGREVDQRKIVKETDFSKTKVSRIIYDLSNRGIVDKIPKGRTNLIKMRKIKSNNTFENKKDINQK